MVKKGLMIQELVPKEKRVLHFRALVVERQRNGRVKRLEIQKMDTDKSASR